jgi:hypothetical protein
MSVGSRGHIGIKKEVTWKTRVVGANDVFLPFVSEGLTRDIEDLMSAAHRAILDEPVSYQGEKSFGGPLVVEVHPKSIGHVFRSALGAPAAEALADSVETEFCDCETIWEHTDTVIPSLEATIKKKGTYSSKLQVSAAAAVGVLASRIITYDFAVPATTHYKFWLRCDIALDAADLAFVISEQALGAEGASFDLVNIPAMAVAGQWYEHTIAISDVSDMETAISVAIKMLVDKGEFTLWVDDIRAVVAGTATTAYKHIFTPMQTLAEEFGAGAKYTPLFPYTFEVFRDEGQAYEFLGCVVNTMGLSFSNTDKILKANLGIIAGDAGYVAATGVGLEATAPFVWANAKIYLGGVTDPGDRYNDLGDFNMLWDNKCIARFSLNNSYTPRKIIRMGFREIPVNFTVDFTDKTEYDLFLAGTERQMRIIFIGAVISGDGASTPYTLQLDFPKIRYLAWPIVMPSDQGRLMVAVTAKAKYSGGFAFKATVINEQRTAEYEA